VEEKCQLKHVFDALLLIDSGSMWIKLNRKVSVGFGQDVVTPRDMGVFITVETSLYKLIVWHGK